MRWCLLAWVLYVLAINYAPQRITEIGHGVIVSECSLQVR